MTLMAARRLAACTHEGDVPAVLLTCRDAEVNRADAMGAKSSPVGEDDCCDCRETRDGQQRARGAGTGAQCWFS